MTLESLFWFRCPDLISWTWTSIKTRCAEASVWNSVLLEVTAALPTVLPVCTEGLMSPQNDLEFFQALWAHFLQCSRRYLTVTGPKGDSPRTCWKCWNFLAVEKHVNDPDISLHSASRKRLMWCHCLLTFSKYRSVTFSWRELEAVVYRLKLMLNLDNLYQKMKPRESALLI